MTWRSLYACSNGWRGLRPGCFDMLELPCRSDWNKRYPTHCILDGQELGWTAAAGDASELLVVNTWFSLQVTPAHPLAHTDSPLPAHAWLTCFLGRQVVDCKTRQLVQVYRQDSRRSTRSHHMAMAALPAGRLAAGNRARGIDMITLDMDGAELAPAGLGCRHQPPNVTRRTLLSADAFARCAACPGRA